MFVHEAKPYKLYNDDIGFNSKWAVTLDLAQQQAFITKSNQLLYPFLVKYGAAYILVLGYKSYIEVYSDKVMAFLGTDTNEQTLESLKNLSTEAVVLLFKELSSNIAAEGSLSASDINTWFSCGTLVKKPQKKMLFNDPLANLLKDLEAPAPKTEYSWTVGKQGISFKQQTTKEELPF